MALFCYTLISNVIVFVIVSLDNYKHVQDILICYMSINILFLTYGICGYVLIATHRRHLLENEVLDVRSQKSHLKFLATRQGIFLDYSIIYLMY